MQKLKAIGEILVGLLIIVVGVEFVSFLYLSSISKSVHGPSHYYSLINTGFHSADCSWGDKISVHPYLSIRYHRMRNCSDERANSRGMLGEEVPFKKDNDHYNILILGGSVAEILYNSHELDKYLNSKFVSPNGKAFKVWNGAMTAGQQPRQAISHMMTGQWANAVISLEGFNEHFSFSTNTNIEDPPRAWYEVEGTLSNLRRNSFKYSVSHLLRQFSLKAQNNFFLSKSFFLPAMLPIAFKMAEVNNQQELSDSVSPAKADTPEEAQKQFTETYSSYLLSMNQTAKARKQEFVVFIQPVPALHKKLTPADKAIIKDLDYGPSYLKMIKLLVENPLHQTRIIPILDTFEKHEGDLYVDLIHFRGESDGNAWLARRMGNELANVLKWKKI